MTPDLVLGEKKKFQLEIKLGEEIIFAGRAGWFISSAKPRPRALTPRSDRWTQVLTHGGYRLVSDAPHPEPEDESGMMEDPGLQRRLFSMH